MQQERKISVRTPVCRVCGTRQHINLQCTGSLKCLI